MKFRLKTTLLLFLFMYLLVSCSNNKNLVKIDKNRGVLRKDAIIVFDVQWVDNSLNISNQEVKEIKSFDLLSNEALIQDRLLEIEGNTSRLNSPLYYLSKFDFEIVNENEASFKFIRFNRNLDEYEPFAIFDISPGHYSLNKINFHTYKFKKAKEKRGRDDLWFRQNHSVQEKIGQWNLEAGKIYYLGSFIFYFKTKRFNYGMINQFVLNKEVRFMGLKTEDKFQQVKDELIKTKPWLPVGEMVNLSNSLKWFHKTDQPLKFDEQIKLLKKQREEKSEEKRDTEKFFY
jgi:hypothetical protein